MMKILFILMLGGFAFGNDLLDKLHAELSQKGETSFSNLQIAFIADGISDEAALNAAVEEWEKFTARYQLSERESMGKSKTKVKTLQNRLKKHLKKGMTDNTSFLDLARKGNYTKLSVSWVFAKLGQKGGLVAADFSRLLKILDPYFFKDREINLREITAAYLIYQANLLPDERQDDMVKALSASHMLAAINYEEESLGKPFYNRVKKGYDEAMALEEAGKKDEASDMMLNTAILAVAVTDCYPKMAVFEPVCFNIGTKLIQLPAAHAYPQKVTDLLLGLTEHTGKHRVSFESNLQIHLYNHGARLFNEKKYDEAAATFERITSPPDKLGYDQVLTSCYTVLVDKAFEDKDTEKVRSLMVKLEKVDPTKAEVMSQRLKQLELIDLVKSGGMDEALTLAAKDTVSDINKKNYISVLTQYNQAKRGLEEFEGALKVLDEAIIEDWSKESVENLRLNTYVDWEKTYKEEDFKGQIFFFGKLFADEKLVTSEKNKDIFAHNYGRALHASIVKLIETRKWKEAREENKKALKLVPEHKDLLVQRALIDQIIKRVGGG